jgi:hypothetical protein
MSVRLIVRNALEVLKAIAAYPKGAGSRIENDWAKEIVAKKQDADGE